MGNGQVKKKPEKPPETPFQLYEPTIMLGGRQPEPVPQPKPVPPGKQPSLWDYLPSNQFYSSLDAASKQFGWSNETKAYIMFGYEFLSQITTFDTTRAMLGKLFKWAWNTPMSEIWDQLKNIGKEMYDYFANITGRQFAKDFFCVTSWQMFGDSWKAMTKVPSKETAQLAIFTFQLALLDTILTYGTLGAGAIAGKGMLKSLEQGLKVLSREALIAIQDAAENAALGGMKYAFATLPVEGAEFTARYTTQFTFRKFVQTTGYAGGMVALKETGTAGLTFMRGTGLTTINMPVEDMNKILEVINSTIWKSKGIPSAEDLARLSKLKLAQFDGKEFMKAYLLKIRANIARMEGILDGTIAATGDAAAEMRSIVQQVKEFEKYMDQNWKITSNAERQAYWEFVGKDLHITEKEIASWEAGTRQLFKDELTALPKTAEPGAVPNAVKAAEVPKPPASLPEAFGMEFGKKYGVPQEIIPLGAQGCYVLRTDQGLFLVATDRKLLDSAWKSAEPMLKPHGIKRIEGGFVPTIITTASGKTKTVYMVPLVK